MNTKLHRKFTKKSITPIIIITMFLALFGLNIYFMIEVSTVINAISLTNLKQWLLDNPMFTQEDFWKLGPEIIFGYINPECYNLYIMTNVICIPIAIISVIGIVCGSVLTVKSLS